MKRSEAIQDIASTIITESCDNNVAPPNFDVAQNIAALILDNLETVGFKPPYVQGLKHLHPLGLDWGNSWEPEEEVNDET